MLVQLDSYSAMRSKKPSTSSRMFAEKNLGNSVEDGVKDRGGMCCKAFLENKKSTREQMKGFITTKPYILPFNSLGLIKKIVFGF